ncbi:MAG: DUF488 domain-containing protein [Acidimicrobiia bacterium]|nr:DUF488 domain-containing protein [Acidimicrobiia bacterium]
MKGDRPPPIRTVGHGTLGADAFADLVIAAGIEVIVDIRRFPGSRRHPHFGREALEAGLSERGIHYRWMEGLGGRRHPDPDSPNTGLRNEQFRAYADHMCTEEFSDALVELTTLAASRVAAVMCAESVWWRCHRRLVADHLILVENLEVEHLFHDGRLVAHAPTPEARRVDHHLVYDISAQGSLPGT